MQAFLCILCCTTYFYWKREKGRGEKERERGRERGRGIQVWGCEGWKRGVCTKEGSTPSLKPLTPSHSTFLSTHPFLRILLTSFPLSYTQWALNITHALPSDLSCWKLLHEVTSVGRGPGASYLQVQPLPAVLPPTWGFSNINTAGAKQGVASFLNTAVLKVALDPALHVAAPRGAGWMGGCFCKIGRAHV